MQLSPVSASTAQQSSQLQSLFQQSQSSGSSQAAQFNRLMNQMDNQSGATAPSSTTPTSGTPSETPVHHHHGHHHRGAAGSETGSSSADALSAMLSQSGTLAQSTLPASMTTNTTALDPTSILGA